MPVPTTSSEPTSPAGARTQQVLLRGYHGQPTSGTVTSRQFSRDERVRRAFAGLGKWWGVAVVSVLIPAGQYLVFTGSGDIPAAVLGAWRQVWAYFARADAPARAFSTDFEQYDPADPSRVRIHIALSAAVRQALA